MSGPPRQEFNWNATNFGTYTGHPVQHVLSALRTTAQRSPSPAKSAPGSNSQEPAKPSQVPSQSPRRRTRTPSVVPGPAAGAAASTSRHPTPETNRSGNCMICSKRLNYKCTAAATKSIPKDIRTGLGGLCVECGNAIGGIVKNDNTLGPRWQTSWPKKLAQERLDKAWKMYKFRVSALCAKTKTPGGLLKNHSSHESKALWDSSKSAGTEPEKRIFDVPQHFTDFAGKWQLTTPISFSITITEAEKQYKPPTKSYSSRKRRSNFHPEELLCLVCGKPAVQVPQKAQAVLQSREKVAVCKTCFSATKAEGSTVHGESLPSTLEEVRNFCLDLLKYRGQKLLNQDRDYSGRPKYLRGTDIELWDRALEHKGSRLSDAFLGNLTSAGLGLPKPLFSEKFQRTT